MPENNEPKYELDHDYEPLGIVDAADGSGTTWPEFVGQVDKMDKQVAALTEECDSRFQEIAVVPYPASRNQLKSVEFSSSTSSNRAVLQLSGTFENGEILRLIITQEGRAYIELNGETVGALN